MTTARSGRAWTTAATTETRHSPNRLPVEQVLAKVSINMTQSTRAGTWCTTPTLEEGSRRENLALPAKLTATLHISRKTHPDAASHDTYHARHVVAATVLHNRYGAYGTRLRMALNPSVDWIRTETAAKVCLVLPMAKCVIVRSCNHQRWCNAQKKKGKTQPERGGRPSSRLYHQKRVEHMTSCIPNIRMASVHVPGAFATDATDPTPGRDVPPARCAKYVRWPWDDCTRGSPRRRGVSIVASVCKSTPDALRMAPSMHTVTHWNWHRQHTAWPHGPLNAPPSTA